MSVHEFFPERSPDGIAEQVADWYRNLPEGSFPHIRNWTAFLEGIADWSMLKGCFGRGIRVGDCDGIVESRGRLLLLDRKTLKASRALNVGQSRMFKTLAKRGDTAIVFWCDDPAGSDISDIRVYAPGRIGVLLEDASLERFRTEVVRWFVWAEENPAA